ncbi:MAG TPA: mechanosensitive ion channel family protein [Chloroflexi bacterium]|nr:MAG: mechanosensitive ion channel family protein [Chloroflexota bacterium]HDD54913.1 mechanosensitive ion channel family protein [Chloroflexota bacterium]
MDILDKMFLENSLRLWLIGAGTAIGVFLLLLLARKLVKGRLKRLAEKSTTRLDDYLVPLLEGTHWFSILALGLWLGSQFLQLPGETQLWFSRVLQILLILQLGFWGTGLISDYISRTVALKIEKDRGEDATTLDAMGLIGKIAMWVILALIALDNLDVEISSLVTSLGIGGIAVALAVQNILGDLFASLSIALDKPFSIGDFIVVDDFEGNVEDIGLKSTRVRSLSGEELVFSNTDLLNSRIRNYKRLEKRRISFSVGVVYGTAAEKLEKIPGMVEEIIKPLPNVRFERAHFKNLGEYSLDFAVVYYVLVPDYALYLDIQQQINLALYQRFEKEGIEFAYPTQTVLVESE